MKTGLFEVLNGGFSDGTRLDEVVEEQLLVRSVIDNLNRLFNVRQGAMENLPAYGLPELTEMYRDTPENVEALRRAIQAAVEAYEPRLQYLRVIPQPSQNEGRLTFLLTGSLVDGARVQFQTTFEQQVRVSTAPAN